MDNQAQYIKRLYPVSAFTGLLDDALTHLDDLRGASQTGLDRQFGERIMLAVTEVNGCRYCSYFHTKQALTAGISQEEVDSLLAGEFSDVPPRQKAALLFAQHYADSGGSPEEKAVAYLQQEYGKDLSRSIMAYIRMIMVGNSYGNAFDAFRLRLLGRPVDGSTLPNELGVLISVLVVVPWIMVRQVVLKVSRIQQENTR